MLRPLFRQALVCLVMLSVMTTKTQNNQFLKAGDYEKLAALNRDGLECQKLCIGKILTKCLKSRNIKAESLETDYASIHNLCNANSI